MGVKWKRIGILYVTIGIASNAAILQNHALNAALLWKKIAAVLLHIFGSVRNAITEILNRKQVDYLQ